ncbi:6-phosphogluconate dehydrogenase C-terminal domain-like protein [Calocera viscosa TUFC12733]|uniref:phosphogluconate dehydrogenase (NADP(+)-dependent, decarboxylating) n=1 Tax=Calocera viscosa (strain TUFC12733) TaxID=1330018 RepID=A0A167PMJ2_CALVF|nr:6-phosphogluconate dehydrogenase C-terminal domain-like protein [Calocera viscosa TUFC12733]
MAFLFSEHGSAVSGFDAKQSVRDDLKSKLEAYDRHLPTIDKVLRQLLPHLDPGDVVLDGANEWCENTQRRQEWLMKEKQVHFIGLGVSGGYQAARKGPSMSPGGTKEAYAIVEPLLKKWAAKDGNGNPCVALMGPGGAGHHVKMVHNGIEQGLLGVIAEAHGLLRTQLGYSSKEIADIFERWNARGELRDNYLLGIARRYQGSQGHFVQDVDETEGTGYWTFREAGMSHVAVPTIAASHQMRIVSANKNERKQVAEDLQLPQPSATRLSVAEKEEFLKQLRLALYGGMLASFIQGYGIIARASLNNTWHVSLANCNKIWRAGCIIQSNAIVDLLQPHLEKEAVEGQPAYENLLLIPDIAKEVARTYRPLKRVLALALDADAAVPSLSASLEWMKTVGGESLPTSFMEAEMDYFGAHNYDVKGEHRWEPAKGKHHTEFKPAEQGLSQYFPKNDCLHVHINMEWI